MLTDKSDKLKQLNDPISHTPRRDRQSSVVVPHPKSEQLLSPLSDKEVGDKKSSYKTQGRPRSLTRAQVYAMRNLYRNDRTCTMASLADAYNVSVFVVHCALRGKSTYANI